MNLDWRALVAAYEALTEGLRPSSRRQYRAALKFWIERFRAMQDALLFTEAAADIDRAWRSRQRTGSGEGSARRNNTLLRQMPEAVRRRIAYHLYGVGTVYALMAGDLLLATPVLGLRPKEWGCCSIEGDVLRVQNSKYIKDLRANGEVRTLTIDREQVAADEMEAAQRLILWMQGRTWDAARTKLQPRLKAALKSLIDQGLIERKWRHLRFYDGRHQFSAEAKATLEAGKGEVAAVMGHSSALTAVHHYGRRRRAERPSAVQPSADSVAAVKAKTIDRLNKIMQRRGEKVPEHSLRQAPERNRGALPSE
ncbi:MULTISPECIES: hypothetical protein [unclassified Xanthobacter]|uniref:hypothetical protein n=1 Tax=unclassified Xanthobacter TaxID=2623496 RepID=UPI001F2CE0CC|nr:MULTISPECIES: hypothetical protein [unclassified Xanthobacter]